MPWVILCDSRVELQHTLQDLVLFKSHGHGMACKVPLDPFGTWWGGKRALIVEDGRSVYVTFNVSIGRVSELYMA